MFIWSKLSSAKWEDAWEERFHAAANTGLVITKLPNAKIIRVEVYCHRRENAEQIMKLFGGRIRELKQKNWQALAAKSLKPISIRGKLLIVHTEEAFESIKKKHPDKAILLIPGEMAFGTGDHTTTASCLRILHDFSTTLEAGRKWDMLDLGCGTGILALAAKALGASTVEGCDFDAAAVRISKKNAISNKLAGIRFFAQDVLKWQPKRQYDLVMANIFHDVLTVSFEKIAQATRPGGMVVVSGILAEQAENVANAATKAGLRVTSQLKRGKWVTITAQLDGSIS
jgi:ribosomal protein L11 methyltransferase